MQIRRYDGPNRTTHAGISNLFGSVFPFGEYLNLNRNVLLDVLPKTAVIAPAFSGKFSKIKTETTLHSSLVNKATLAADSIGFAMVRRANSKEICYEELQ